jgi:hypothetical protein
VPTLALPVVRSLVVCEDIVTDPNNPARVSLMYLVGTIRATGSKPYPAVRPQLCVFAQLAECRGPHSLWAEVRHADTDTVIFRTQVRSVTFPNAPLTVYGWPLRFQNLVFPEPGLYWVQLLCDHALLAQQPLRLTSPEAISCER